MCPDPCHNKHKICVHIQIHKVRGGFGCKSINRFHRHIDEVVESILNYKAASAAHIRVIYRGDSGIYACQVGFYGNDVGNDAARIPLLSSHLIIAALDVVNHLVVDNGTNKSGD